MSPGGVDAPGADRRSAARPHIGVVGAGEASPQLLALAGEVGAELARHDAVLVCGGLGGVMEAACAGAQRAGGVTVGLLPGRDRHDANPFVDVAIATGLGELRNGLIVRASDVLIAIGGEWGTLSEIALALKERRPVIGLFSWELDRAGLAGPERVGDPAQAVQRALALAAG